MTTDITPAEDPPSDALLVLLGGGRLPVGRDRIAMLQAVAAHGGITAAAKALGYNYKAAPSWRSWPPPATSSACRS
jgi:hypothetical protein